MARRTKAREILRLLEAGMPRSAIARALSVSKHSVQAVAEAEGERGVGWVEAEAMGDAETYEALFPEKVRDRDVCVPSSKIEPLPSLRFESFRHLF